ncbi:MAG: sensor histidine kinase [Henriciella sp.]
MPNRPDHSVKTKPIDREYSINSFVMAIGSAVAGIGALTVILSGSLIGIWLGASLLTALIILQLIALLQRSGTEPTNIEVAPSLSTIEVVTENDPILVLSVSKQGRIRAYQGHADYVPGLKVGKILEEILPQFEAKTQSNLSLVTGAFSVFRWPSSAGEIVLLTPQIEDRSDAKSEVLERTQFFASLGHDLKSPLNGIIGFADIMDAELRGPLPDAYKDYPSLIRESGDTLMRLVEDILGYAKAEAGTYELDVSPLDVAASGESVFRQSEGIAELSGVTLKLRSEGEVMALADAGAVRRIWDNLVSNAIKYSARGDTVTMRAFEKNGMCVLSVRDTGAGMDAEDLARIARPFAQGRNAKGRAGTGLGLAMVQRLAELQSGQVRIETMPGQGTQVMVTLPALSAAQKRAAE